MEKGLGGLRSFENRRLRNDLIITIIYNGKTFSTTSLKKQHRQYRKLVKIKKWLMLTGGGREFGKLVFRQKGYYGEKPLTTFDPAY